MVAMTSRIALQKAVQKRDNLETTDAVWWVALRHGQCPESTFRSPKAFVSRGGGGGGMLEKVILIGVL